MEAGEQVVQRGAGTGRGGGDHADDQGRALDLHPDERRIVDRDRRAEPVGLFDARTGAADDHRYFDFERFGGCACGDESPPFGCAPGPRLNAPETIGAVSVRRDVSAAARSRR